MRSPEELQRIREAVLAELRRVCPEDGSKYPLWSGSCIKRVGGLFAWTPSSISTQRDQHYPTEMYRIHQGSDMETEFFYRLLGLEARDMCRQMYEALNIAQAEIRGLYPRLGINNGNVLTEIDEAMDNYKKGVSE
jgi:hypothetical protein